MKRSFKLSLFLSAGLVALLAASPAFAQDYYSTGDGAAGAIVCGVYACLGIVGLILFGFWVWMLIDAIARQEYEFPNSSGNSKMMWLLILLLTWAVSAGWIAAIVYYFVVYKKVKRGSVQPPSAGGYGGGYQPPAAPPQAPPPPPPMSPPAPPPAGPTG